MAKEKVNFFGGHKKSFKEGFVVTGRDNRQYYIVMLIIILSATKALEKMPENAVAIIFWVLAMAAWWTSNIRRLHDIEKSGWLSLLLLIPVVNLGLVTWLAVTKGTQGPNKYGLDPLEKEEVA